MILPTNIDLVVNRVCYYNYIVRKQMNLKKYISPLMRYLASVFVFLLFCFPVAASEKEDVQAIINGQFQAFLEGDVSRAFTYASPSIRSIFETPQNFGEMVQNGYPMIWRPASVTFLENKQTPQGRTQDVQIFDAAGTAHYVRYFVTQTPSGWKISGVQLLDVAGISV
mgnify:FL=1